MKTIQEAAATKLSGLWWSDQVRWLDIAGRVGWRDGEVDLDLDLGVGGRYLAQLSGVDQELALLFPDPDFPAVNPLSPFRQVRLPELQAFHLQDPCRSACGPCRPARCRRCRQ